MLLIENLRTEPYFNLALEEYLFRNFEEDCFMLWRNEDAIVVGKHQNALAEINATYADENNIKVVRRLSGGGTVFHDLGNINFTFILTRETEKVVDFKRYMKPIYEVLIDLQLNATYSERNDLFIDGKKISGNAEHAVKNKVLHHGTLLFSSELNRLGQALKVIPEAYKDKAVKSVRSPVTNIQPYLKNRLEIDAFMNLLNEHVERSYGNCKVYKLTAYDDEQINKLVTEKYATWDWNYGYSPKYQFSNSISFKGGVLALDMAVKKGVIENITLKDTELSMHEINSITNALIGIPHRLKTIREKLLRLAQERIISSDTVNALLGAMV